jgi:hypothetical protein
MNNYYLLIFQKLLIIKLHKNKKKIIRVKINEIQRIKQAEILHAECIYKSNNETANSK